MKKSTPTIARQVLSIIVCLTMIFSISCPSFAAGKGVTTVKVGFFKFEGYHQQNENGNRSGYGYEMLQHIAGYANLRYEYVGYDKSWEEMQEMLERGEIDILTSAQSTPERQAKFGISTTNIGVSAAVLTVKEGDKRYLSEDYSNWDGIRVGMLEGSSRNDSFALYAREHGFTYKPVMYDDSSKMVAELKSDKKNKKIDAVLTSNLRHMAGETILAQFDSSPFFVMTQKSNTKLLDKINNAIVQIDANEPGLRTKLMNKYYDSTKSGVVIFTPDERKYINSLKNKKITAVINPDRAPYSWLEDGEYKGIIADFAQEIIDKSGLDIEFLKVSTREEYEKAIDDGATDLRFDAEYNTNLAEKDGCWLSSVYATIPVGKLYRKDTKTFKTAAMPKSRDINNAYKAKLEESGLKVTEYDSVDKIAKAVLKGKADVAYLALDSATLQARDDITNKLIAEEVYGDKISYCITVNQDQGAVLYSIINKVIASLNTNELDIIRQEYASRMEKEFSLVGYFYEYPIQVIIAILLILGIVVLLFALKSQGKRKEDARKYYEKEREQNLLLKDALDVAEQAGAAKSQFLSRVSHEMRTPLNAIIGFIELAKGAGEEDKENYMASSDIAAKQLLNVINDVLDMSSIDSGKMKIAKTPFSFKHLVSSITNIYGTQCKQKSINYETKIMTPVDDWLVGDELRLNQILMNLLGNAIKFTATGHIWLTISQTSAKEGEVFLRFEIDDTGCGMSPEMQERIFKPFEQESASTARKYGGSGLGLSIVKNLTSMMDGAVRVESQQGVGTKFIVDLPFGISEIKSETEKPKRLNDIHVLAVDDEEGERKYISKVLERMNVRHSCVKSGEEALAELERAGNAGDVYNVCLVDWRMPGMNGYDTTEKIRTKYGKDMVVIIVSAYDFEQAGEKAKEAGANLFLSKPIFQSSLFDMLMTLTGGSIAEVPEEEVVWDFAGKRVLLAEDNVLNQIVARGYMAQYNIVVDLAEDGKECYEMFLKSEPGYYDAILMDIQMPVMDGFESTKAIRESSHQEAKTIQIIAQTADAFNEDIAKVLAAGMNDHVAKPIKLELLGKALYEAFERNNDK